MRDCQRPGSLKARDRRKHEIAKDEGSPKGRNRQKRTNIEKLNMIYSRRNKAKIVLN